MNPLRNICRLAIGDALAKGLNFVVFVYLARLLGAESYGTLEFALSVMAYVMLLGDGGLEIWATRETAHGRNLHEIVGMVVPMRICLALIAFVVLLMTQAALPSFPHLRMVILLFGLTLFTQAFDLKWAFLGQERMGHVISGLLIANVVFALGVVMVIRAPEQFVWVPILRVAGDACMVVFFWRQFAHKFGLTPLVFAFRPRHLIGPAMTLGAAHGLSLLSFNFDSLILGFMRGADAVGYYGVAYKPVLVALALPVTYFRGLLPSLSRTFHESQSRFREIINDSMRLMSVFALPLCVCGVFLAEPILRGLYGSQYTAAIPVFQILIVSGALVALRGTFRQALNAASQQGVDLRCAIAAVTVNVSLNIILIPRYGIIGAASATLASEIVWFVLLAACVYRCVCPVNLVATTLPALVAAFLMVMTFLVRQPLVWVGQLLLALTIYIAAIVALGQANLLARAFARRAS